MRRNCSLYLVGRLIVAMALTVPAVQEAWAGSGLIIEVPPYVVHHTVLGQPTVAGDVKPPCGVQTETTYTFRVCNRNLKCNETLRVLGPNIDWGLYCGDTVPVKEDPPGSFRFFRFEGVNISDGRFFVDDIEDENCKYYSFTVITRPERDCNFRSADFALCLCDNQDSLFFDLFCDPFDGVCEPPTPIIIPVRLEADTQVPGCGVPRRGIGYLGKIRGTVRNSAGLLEPDVFIQARTGICSPTPHTGSAVSQSGTIAPPRPRTLGKGEYEVDQLIPGETYIVTAQKGDKGCDRKEIVVPIGTINWDPTLDPSRCPP